MDLQSENFCSEDVVINLKRKSSMVFFNIAMVCCGQFFLSNIVRAQETSGEQSSSEIESCFGEKCETCQVEVDANGVETLHGCSLSAATCPEPVALPQEALELKIDETTGEVIPPSTPPAANVPVEAAAEPVPMPRQ